MAFDSQTRNKLQRMVGACRRLLADEFDDQLQGLYGIYAKDGRVLDLEKLTNLDDDDHQTATLLRDRIEHLCSGMPAEKQPLAEAVRRVLREQAFTLLNRFAALRMAEERGFVQECVGQGLKSKGFQVFETVARSGLGGAYERYATFIHGMFDELSLDLGVLFDRWSPFGLLFPREPALLKFFDLLNDPELKPLWKEDETVGWIYQYFNDEAERKKMREESAAPRNSRELAVRNQFFTPRYVVEFLTDNTLGRIWYEMTQGQTRLKEQCRYQVRRPDEVFFGHMTDPKGEHADQESIEAARLLCEGDEQTFIPFEANDKSIQRMICLAHTVNGYARHPNTEETWRWVTEYKRRVLLPASYGDATTQDILDVLFLECRNDRHGGDGSIYRERWFVDACNEARRRVFESRKSDLPQEQLLKQPVFIPHRPIKDPRTILMLDPACGSMHFGLYAFDLFEVIYDEAWELEKRGAGFQNRPPGMLSLQEMYGTKEDFLKDVPRLIIEHNLHGIDIDPRCAQIAGLSLWLRAQKAWQRLGLKPAERPAIKRSNIVCAEPMPGEKELLREFVEREFPVEEHGIVLRLLEAIFDKMQLAGEAGSLLKIEEEIRSAIEDARQQWQTARQRPEFFDTSQLATLDKRAGAQQELPAAERASMATDLRSLTSEDFWERIEERIYAALRDYAEQAENGGGFQRRLFAEDAARGFAFIDVCRKRYDVALMNPPFGKCSDAGSAYYESGYSDFKADIGIAFVDRFLHLADAGGCVGAITSRAFLASDSFEDWRAQSLLEKTPINCFLDLGYGVLDSAMVEAAAYVVDAKAQRSGPRPFIRVLESRDKELSVRNFFTTHRQGDDLLFFLHDLSEFRHVPLAVICYWLPASLLLKLQKSSALPDSGGAARHGLVTTDDFRFLRVTWEIPASQEASEWKLLAKGGEYQPFWDDLHICVDWSGNGQRLKTFLAEKRLKTQGSADWTPWLNHSEYYLLEGLTYPERTTSDFCPRALPKDVIFSSTGQAIQFAGERSPAFAYLCGSFTRFFKLVVESFVGSGDNAFPGSAAKHYRSGLLNQLPAPLIDGRGAIESIGREGIQFAKSLFEQDETARNFSPCRRGGSLRETVRRAQAALLTSAVRVIHSNTVVEQLVADRFELSKEELVVLDEIIGPHPQSYSEVSLVDADEVQRLWSKTISEMVEICVQKDGPRRQLTKKTFIADRKLELICHAMKAQPVAVVRAIETSGCLDPEACDNIAPAELSFALGCVLGRWDIRYATGEKSAPELPDPFAPLPVCPPGQLQNAQGLPVEKAESGKLKAENYPIEIPWDGILVDDPNHPLDIERRVREVNEIIWKDRTEAIEHEACEILGLKSLRDYFRKPAGFFADHLKRYSKSRRQAPIYWPLSTASGSYTLWIYYHRLTDQTLFQCVNDFVKPKLEEVNRDIERLRGELQRAGGGSSKQRETLEELENFTIELKEFHDELLRVAGLPYKPNLNDGVLINASPLWKLFRLPKWQKDLKACWAALEGEEYEWAHLAYTIWPDRVKKVCKTDRSIAIAHGLEELCDVKAPERKAKRGKKKADAELDLVGGSE